MCIVVDTCAFSSVFITTDKDHLDFKPIYDWLMNGDGKLVYGGKTYFKELETAHKFLKILTQLQRMGKTIKLPDKEIDDYEKKVKRKVNKKDFDDPHILSILAISNCKLVCTKDKRSMPYLKNLSLYPKKFIKPKIYSKKCNLNILCDDNIASICIK